MTRSGAKRCRQVNTTIERTFGRSIWSRTVAILLNGIASAENRVSQGIPKVSWSFLLPDRMAASDKYADSDPYTIGQNIGSAFQKRRIELTVELARQALSSVQGIPRVLDLGCGQGYITQELHQRLKSAEITGLDCSVSAIEFAHDHFCGIDFAVGDAYEPPYSMEHFDLVICNSLWEHIPDPLHLLSKIREILKTGGYIIVSTPSRYRVVNLVRILKGKPVTFMLTDHVTEYTVGQVVEQLRYGGFQIRKILSRPISMGSLKAEIARRLFAVWVSLVGSHHQLEATVFYLAEKASSSTEQTLRPWVCG